MATKIFFRGKQESIPGAYSQIKSGIKNPALSLAYGNTLLINTGSDKFFAGGAGINGELKNGKAAHVTFDNLGDTRRLIKGGVWWLLAGPMFLPGGGATAGISSLTYIKAATTVPAEIFIPFGATDESDSDLDITNDGSLTIKVRDEGYNGNGVLGDETRAKATITVTNAGAAGDVLGILIDGETVGAYTVETGDTIATVVAGIAAAIDENGLSAVFSQNATQVVIYAPSGYADELNGIAATVSVTGSVAASSSTFAGGIEGTILTRGYAASLDIGEMDTSKYVLKFYRGTFKGYDGIISNSTPAPYDGLAEISTRPELVAQSPEVDTVQELVDWMQDETGEGFIFNQYFYLSSYTIASATDEILPEDLVNNIRAVGGTESYSSEDLADVLDSIEDLNFDFIIADNWGDNARSQNNLAIVDYITNVAVIQPDLYIGGGQTEGEFSGNSLASVELARAFDSQNVVIVHGGPNVTAVGRRGFKEYDSIYKAAVALGRIAGIQPQNPPTFKGLGIQGEQHPLKKKQIRLGLDAGVLMTRLDNGSFEIIKGVNTLQNNTYLANPDGTTHSIQLGRIERQLNKEIVVNSKEALLKKPNGANRNTVSPEDVKAWLEGYLDSKIATNQDDDLIISYQAVTVTRSGDAYDITYAFEANTEVSFLVFTGTVIDLS
jgi:hypothetical protein